MNTKQLAYNRPDVPLDVVRQLRHQLVLAAGDVKRYEQFSRNEWIATPAAEGLRTLIADADAWIADLKETQGESE